MANTVSTGITLSTSGAIAALTNGQKIMIAEAKKAMEPAAPDPELVSSATMPPGHKQHDILTYARLADAVQLTEGTDLSEVQQLAANYLSINPSEHGVIVTLSKRAMSRQADASLEAMAGGMQGIAMRARQAKDIIALYDGASKSVGGAGTTLDITHFRGTAAFLMTDNDTEFGPAPMPLVAALHAEGISDLILDLTTGAGSFAENRNTGLEDGLSADLVKRWWRGSDRAYGIQVFHSGYIARDSGDDYKGVIMSQEALMMVLEGGDDTPTEQDVSHRLTEFGMFKAWGEGERADPYLVEMFFDGSATV